MAQACAGALAGAALFATAAGGALAAGAAGPGASAWDVAFGVTVTSNYVSRGHTQSDDGPAVQPWAELGNGFFYVGYWGSNTSPVSVGGNWEHDFSIGIRPTLGPLETDFGYTRYVYDTGDCCGEAYAKASYSPIDPLTLSGAVYYDPENSAGYAEATAAADLLEKVSVSATVGTTFDGESSWNAGATWTPRDWVSFDGRVHGGVEGTKFLVSMSLSSSLSALKKH
jgi:uncharacterized protein (TIGR02001 family)